MNIRNESRVNSINVGIREFMCNVYTIMAIGLFITGLVAYVVSESPALLSAIFHNSAVSLMVSLAPLFFVFIFSAKIGDMSVPSAQLCFFAFSALMGISTSYIFLVYTGASIAQTFFVTAATFLSMSLYGYTTKKDLTSFGSFLIMGVIGIVIASLINIFVRSSGFSLLLSVLTVIIFTGLTAYDVQRIRYTFSEMDGADVNSKKAIFGALQLYLDFINIFLKLLRLMGRRRD